MNSRIMNFAIVCLTLLFTACGGGKDTTNTIPQAEDPNAGTTTPLPTTTPAADSRLPEWVTRAAPISLAQTGIYTALESLLLQPNEKLVAPVVGDPLVAMDIASGRSTQVVGKLYLGVEDKEGFAWREWKSLDAASYRDSNVVDGLFMDDEVVVRVSGPIQNAHFKGTINYRFRASGETQCQTTKVTTCTWVPYCTQPAPNGYCYVQWQYYQDCHDSTEFDAQACVSYMNSANSSVKSLGSFDVQYDKWIK